MNPVGIFSTFLFAIGKSVMLYSSTPSRVLKDDHGLILLERNSWETLSLMLFIFALLNCHEPSERVR